MGGSLPAVLAALVLFAAPDHAEQEAIDKLIDDLEVEVARKAQQVSGALDREDVEANNQLLEARRSLISRLKQARAKGRVVIRPASADRLKGSTADSGFFSTGRQGLLSTRANQGDSIVVSEKLLETRLMKDLMDIIQIPCQIAVTTGVLIPAF